MYTAILEEMKNAVVSASEIMLSATNIDENTEEKGSRNFVTIYDKKVQSYLKERLFEKFPYINFLGEEDNDQTDPYKDLCFICDPIDGTANFRRSYMHSAISLGLCDKGEIVCGVVIQPYTRELFWGEKNKGAFLNGNKISVSANDFNHSIVAFGSAPYVPELSYKTTKMLSSIIQDCEDIRRTGSAALDLCYVACGRHDFFFELSLYPWDYAAASVIITEAGGVITDRTGSKLPLNKRTEVYAGNKNAYKEFFDKNYFI